MSKIAIIDLLFNWPPDGGARTDVREIATRLATEHEVCLFVPDLSFGFPRGKVEGKMAFEVKKVPFNALSFNLFCAPARFKKEIERYAPDFVFISDGWYLKPSIVRALEKYQPIVRFYAYENLCLRGHGVFYKQGAPCPKDHPGPFSASFAHCLSCALRWLSGCRDKKFIQEFFGALAFLPGHRRSALKALKGAGRVIVYNDFIRRKIGDLCDRISLVPSGVDAKLFNCPASPSNGPFKILMAGRVEDPMKGASVLIEACRRLRQRRYDIELILTSLGRMDEGFIRCVGWKTQEELALLYQEADICVVPSVWQEPFGIVALEAMSSARPVIVSAVGGLRAIFEDGKEGFIVEPGDPEVLARSIERLLKDPALRQEMGKKGREKVLKDYDWDVVYEKYYRPLFSQV